MQNRVLSQLDLNQTVCSQMHTSPPLLTSHAAGWNGIHLEHHYQALCKKPESYFLQHIICIRITTPKFSGRIINGRMNCQPTVAGAVTIVPAKVPVQVWYSLSESIILSLEPTQFSRAIYESVDPDQVELMPIMPKPDPLIYQIGLALKTELATDGVGSRLYAEAMTTALSVHLLKHYTTQKATIRSDSSGLPKVQLNQVIDYINEHLDQDLSLNEMAAMVQMSPTYFAGLFKQSTGWPPHQYVVHQRINRAKRMLLHSELSIAEIATQVGFCDQSHLTRHMRRLLGASPKQLRQQQQ